MVEGAELLVGVATESSQFPEEIDVPEVSVDVAKGSVQIPGVTKDSGVLLVGATVNHSQLPVVVADPVHAEYSGTFEK